MKPNPDQHGRIERRAEKALERGKTFLALRMFMEAGVRGKVREIVDAVSVEIRKKITVKQDESALLIRALLSLGDRGRLDELADYYWAGRQVNTAIAMYHGAQNSEALEQRGCLLLEWGRLHAARDAFSACCSIQTQAGEDTLLDDDQFHDYVRQSMAKRSTDILSGDPAEFHERELDGVMGIYEFLSTQDSCDALIGVGHTCTEIEQSVWAVDAYGRAVKMAGEKTKNIVIGDSLLMKFADLFSEYGDDESYHRACTLTNAMSELEDAGVRHLEAGRLKKAVDAFLDTIPRTGRLKPETRKAIQRTIRRLQLQEHDMVKVGRLAKGKYFADLREKLEEILQIFPE